MSITIITGRSAYENHCGHEILIGSFYCRTTGLYDVWQMDSITDPNRRAYCVRYGPEPAHYYSSVDESELLNHAKRLKDNHLANLYLTIYRHITA